jgi:hypothetical protein
MRRLAAKYDADDPDCRAAQAVIPSVTAMKARKSNRVVVI